MKHSLASLNWNGGWRDAPMRSPETPTEFESQVKRLGLQTLEEQKESRALRQWVKKHYRTRYVPEKLLKHWQLDPPTDFGRGPSHDF